MRKIWGFGGHHTGIKLFDLRFQCFDPFLEFSAVRASGIGD